MEPNILLTRIDNRLVHGQVGVTWTKTLGANLIVVVDDDVAKDRIQQIIMEAVAHSSGAEIRFFTIEKMASTIYEATPEQQIFVVIRNLTTARKLVEAKTPIKNINLGNLHFERGKKAFNKKIYLSTEDIEDLMYLLDQGLKVYSQDVPGGSIDIVKEKDLKKLLEG